MRVDTGKMEKAARLGFLAKGAVYLTIGVLAAMWAFGEGGGVTGGKGAIARIGDLPAGNLLLAVLGFGLACYAGYRFFQAIANPDNDDGGTGTAKRVGYAASGLTHVALAFTAFQALGLSAGSGGSKKTYLAQLFASDGGRWVAVAVGVAVIGAGIYQAYKAYANKVEERLRTGEMSSTERTWIVRLGRAGLAARSVVFGIMGVFLIKAGLSADPGKAKTTSGALQEIAQQSYGTILLAIIALGLAAYGAYMVASARYRRVAA